MLNIQESRANVYCDPSQKHPGEFSLAPGPNSINNLMQRESIDYIDHDAIFINGENDFLNQASSEDWSGTGSQSDPLVIKDYRISGSTNLIEISNTDLFFLISNCLLVGGKENGIVLQNVTNGLLFNNSIESNNQDGLYIISSRNNSIINNTIHDNKIDGIRLYLSRFNTFSGNIISNHTEYGIIVEFSDNNNITDNLIIHNSEDGIYLDFSHRTTIFNNTINYNGYNGAFIDSGKGIFISDSSRSIIHQNNVALNTEGGVIIGSNSKYNVLAWNNFLGNNQTGSSQAYDESLGNIFESNYWDDWASSKDGNITFVEPYLIAGGASNLDELPLSVPFNSDFHLRFHPKVIYPQGNEILSGIVTIEWTPALDSFGHDIIYRILYSPNGGFSWSELKSEITGTRYKWDTTTVPDGSNYVIGLDPKWVQDNVILGELLRTEAFIIQNTSPATTTATTTTTTSSIPIKIQGFEVVIILLSVISILPVVQHKRKNS